MTEANNIITRWWKRTDELFKCIVVVLSISAFISYILSSIYDWVFSVTFFCVAIVLVLFSIICFFSVVFISILLDFGNGFLEFIGIPYALPFSSKRKQQQDHEKLVDALKINIIKYSPEATAILNKTYGNVNNWDRNTLRKLFTHLAGEFPYYIGYGRPTKDGFYDTDFESIDWKHIFKFEDCLIGLNKIINDNKKSFKRSY